MTQQEALQGVLFLRLEKAEDELRRGRQKQRKPPAPPALPNAEPMLPEARVAGGQAPTRKPPAPPALPHPEPMLPEARVAGGQATTQSLAGDLGKWAEQLAAPVLQAATLNTAGGSEVSQSPRTARGVAPPSLCQKAAKSEGRAQSVGSIAKKGDSSIEHSTSAQRIMLKPPAWRGHCTPPAPMHPAPPQP